ncbi:MAG: tRNA threonylcarbamoyladenosine dehydratase [Gammaproteobacteria bacterium]|nr:tRNA threonylcarbamoyladenosine dehydratase [Gammaproteobacteria bacterium]
MGESTDDSEVRFAAVRRVYGESGAAVVRELAVAVVGLGGVGSWAAEALARSGVGRLRLIDPDDIAPSNVNRQLHALDGQFGRAKVEALAERIAAIHPGCAVESLDEPLTPATLERHLGDGLDGVIDAIDVIRFKAAMVQFCRRRKIAVVTTGGAGGLTDPTRIEVADLSRTWNDPLAAKVRSRLRAEFGWTKNPKRRFGVECVFSTEQPRYPRPDGSVGYRKPGVHGATLDCESGYGSLVTVTASFGLVAAARLLNRLVERRVGRPR